MASTTSQSTAEALGVVVRDFGRTISTDPNRLRGLLEDLLGANARAERHNVEAVVVAAEQGVPAALLEDSADEPELEALLTANGMSVALATFGVSTWKDALGMPLQATVPPPGDETVVPNGSPKSRQRSRDATIAGASPVLPPPTGPGASRPVPPPILGDDAGASVVGAPPPAPPGQEAPRRVSSDHHGHRGRWLIAAGAAVAVVAVVVVVILLQNRGGDSVDATTSVPAVTTPSPATTATSEVAVTTAPATTPTTAVTQAFQPETTAWGATLGRSWSTQNGNVVGTLMLANPSGAPVMGSQVEVIPKSMAPNRAALTFSLEPTKVIADDPIVQFDVTLAPGETKTITYQAALSAGVTPNADLLAGWMREWQTAVATYQASLDRTPPDLKIGAPANDQSFDTTNVIVTGSSEPGATVTVNGQAADTDPAGNWSYTLKVVDPNTTITVEAADAAGNKASASVVVHYAPPSSPSPTTTKPRTGGNSPSGSTGGGGGGQTTTPPPPPPPPSSSGAGCSPRYGCP